MSQTPTKIETLKKLRELQAKLTAISFLDALSAVHPENPQKQKILSFQDDLDELVSKIGTFIKENRDVNKEEQDKQEDNKKEDKEDEEHKEQQKNESLEVIYDSSHSTV